ncbi:hypothetical protein [Marinobacter sp.]|uniref:hypothetical protein n=1 Tax=Marinobacter sp. TaxID=50741 RepID=UPI000C8C3271|nr:hypothetical protein [Marinobacter sp.]MAB51357.1 hypothetical protein [Marinobacter sp.]
MSKGGGGDTRQITQTTSAPAYAQPFLEFGLSEAKNIYQNQPSYYPGQTTVGFSPESEMALAGTRQMAIDGSPFIPAVQDVVMQNLMGTNPLQSAAFRPVIEQMQAQASKAGRYGSGYEQGAVAAALAPMAYQAQQAAIAQAPQAREFGFADLNTLAGVGGAREAQSQAELQADIDRYNFEEQQPQMALANYMASVQGGTVGGQSTKPVFRNTAGNVLSGALGGAELAGMVPGMGGGMGAGLGALAGLLG